MNTKATIKEGNRTAGRKIENRLKKKGKKKKVLKNVVFSTPPWQFKMWVL